MGGVGLCEIGVVVSGNGAGRIILDTSSYTSQSSMSSGDRDFGNQGARTGGELKSQANLRASKPKASANTVLVLLS